MFEKTDYDYYLPTSLIAQNPLPDRDASRLLVLDKNNGHMTHSLFRNFTDYLKAGDLLVVNDTRVFPARLSGTSAGKKIEALLLKVPSWSAGGKEDIVTCLVKNSRKFKKGQEIEFGPALHGRILDLLDFGKVRMKLAWEGDVMEVLEEIGSTPLPPYIHRQHKNPDDSIRYQTVYATRSGSVAAPTAGLHFSCDIRNNIVAKGVIICSITLHVGYGTFAPVRAEDIREHAMHEEYYEISREAAELLNAAKKRGDRIIAVGTTTTRALESAALKDGTIRECREHTRIFIYPGYSFKIIDTLLTNFHLPGSTLLMLVSALAGRENILHAYEEAVKRQYRFFSYGDAMLIC